MTETRQEYFNDVNLLLKAKLYTSQKLKVVSRVHLLLVHIYVYYKK